MNFVAYPTCNGICREAFSRYQQIFGGTMEAMTTYGEPPAAAYVSRQRQISFLSAKRED